jgi:Mrp family chromosome partitioning ATPase
VSDFLIDGDWRCFEQVPVLELPHRSRIDILPAGRRLAEGILHLTVQSASALLDELRARYDMIVIDVPPLLGVNDGRLLAMLADDVVFAVRWGRTSRVAATGALKALRSVSANVVGAVLTRVDAKKHALYGEGDCLQYQRAFRKYYAG